MGGGGRGEDGEGEFRMSRGMEREKGRKEREMCRFSFCVFT